jgi:hypothetical protein
MLKQVHHDSWKNRETLSQPLLGLDELLVTNLNIRRDLFRQGKLLEFVIATPVKTGGSNPGKPQKSWIASEQKLLAMTLLGNCRVRSQTLDTVIMNKMSQP